jgi:hypothetical protein
MQALLKGDEQTAKKFALPDIVDAHSVKAKEYKCEDRTYVHSSCSRQHFGDAGVKDMLDDLTQGKITRVRLELVCCAVIFEVVALMYDAFGAVKLQSV